MQTKFELVVNGKTVNVEFKLLGRKPSHWAILARGVTRGVLTRSGNRRWFTARSQRDGLEYCGDTMLKATTALIYGEEK